MFWKRSKPSSPSPLPPAPSKALKELEVIFSDDARIETQRELERIGEEPEHEVLTAGMAMIKMGASELLPGWLSMFGKAEVCAVGIEGATLESAFVFGSPEDRTYLSVFTRRSLAEECLAEMPRLKFIIPAKGITILTLALNRGLGLWINPLNEACSWRVPANLIARFLEESNRPQVATPPSLPPEPPRANAPNRFAEPTNDFERAMLAKHCREMDVNQFIEVLFNSTLYVFAPEGQFTGTPDQVRLVSNPRLFAIIEPSVTYLALFSSQERVRPVGDHYPEFRFALAVHAGDFIMSLATGMGLIINPYWDINFQWSPEQVEGIKELVTK